MAVRKRMQQLNLEALFILDNAPGLLEILCVYIYIISVDIIFEELKKSKICCDRIKKSMGKCEASTYSKVLE